MSNKLTKKDIGSRVTELRKRKGLSQEDLAKKAKKVAAAAHARQCKAAKKEAAKLLAEKE